MSLIEEALLVYVLLKIIGCQIILLKIKKPYDAYFWYNET